MSLNRSRKPAAMIRFNLVLPADLKERLEAQATSEGESEAQIIRRALRDYLKKNAGTKPYDHASDPDA